MKSQKTILVGWGAIFLIVLLAALQVEVWADSQEKQWVVFQDQIPESSARYSIALRYVPSKSTFYKASQRNVKSVVLSESEQIDDYKQRINFDTAVDGYQYSMLIRPAHELVLLNSDRMQILMVQILRSKQNTEPEILQKGYLFLNRQLKIPFELPGQQLGLPTTESVPGTFSINIYGRDQYSYQGSFSTVLQGSLTGSTFIKGVNLELSLTRKESLRPNDCYVNLAVQPLDEKVPPDSTSGKITDVLKLRSAKLVVEKVASDSSEIVLATLDGDISKAKEEWLKSHLGIGKPISPFARVDLLRQKLLTLDELCKEAGFKRHIVLIFGDFKRQLPDYACRGQVTSELMLGEKMILEMLQRDLEYPPVVVFVCRQLFLSDLYEKWLGQDLGFYIIADYSNPMDVQFRFPSRHHGCERPSAKAETLRGQFALPENKVSVLLVNGKGNLEYIDIDAGQQLAETLAKVNKLVSSKR